MSDGLITWLRWAFNIYDKDSSGDIELSEMIDIFVLIYTMQVSWGPPNSKLCTKNFLLSTLNNFFGWFSVPDIFSQFSFKGGSEEDAQIQAEEVSLSMTEALFQFN